MRIRPHILIIYALLLFLLGMRIGQIHAQSSMEPRAQMPVVRNGAPVATTCSPSGTLLLDQDTGAIAASLDGNGRFLVAYQDRAHGSVIHVAQHQADHLVDLIAPAALAPTGDAPQFSPEGPKQGPMALVSMPNGRSRLYYTQRKIGDLTGPYGVWCLEF